MKGLSLDLSDPAVTELVAVREACPRFPPFTKGDAGGSSVVVISGFIVSQCSKAPHGQAPSSGARFVYHGPTRFDNRACSDPRPRTLARQTGGRASWRPLFRTVTGLA